LTATRTALYYNLYDESLELNPEKPKGGERRAEGNINIFHKIADWS